VPRVWVVKNGSNIDSRSAAGTPGPSSKTHRDAAEACSPGASARISMLPGRPEQ